MPKILKLVTALPPITNKGTRYTSYKPSKGGTLTIVNLKQFQQWLNAAVLRQQLKLMERTHDTQDQ
jgi:hypothetical protein